MAFQKGNIPWNKGKECPYVSEVFKGKPKTREHREKLSKAGKGRIAWNKGKTGIYSKEVLRKMGEIKRGKKLSRETKKKISKGLKRRYIKYPEWKKKLSRNFKGVKNPKWKGGIYPLNQLIRHSKDLKIWRKSIWQKDNFTCQRCGQHGGDLIAHHINNFSEFLELRTSIENGITLCKECHRKFHKRYGYKNNTKEQLEEFSIQWIKKTELNT